MNKQQQEQSFDSFVSRQRETLLRKGNDYAGEDRLSNFKVVGAITGQKPEQACLSLIATKVARLSQLLSGKEANNESLEDSILDLAVYSSLLQMIREDAQRETLAQGFDKPYTPAGEKTCGLDTTYREAKHGPAVCYPGIESKCFEIKLEDNWLEQMQNGGVLGKSIEDKTYENNYRCPKCGTTWVDTWSCMVDMDCPECEAKDISPLDEEEVLVDYLMSIPGRGEKTFRVRTETPMGVAGVVVKAKNLDKAIKKLAKQGIYVNKDELLK